MTDPARYPGYDVLAKRRTPSWNDKTRAVIEERLAIDPEAHEGLGDGLWRTLRAVCARIAPQPQARAPIPLAAMIAKMIATEASEGYRDARLPPFAEAWRRGLTAIDAEAQARHRRAFYALGGAEQDGLLTAVERGYATDLAWAGMPPSLFFQKRVLHDVLGAYYAHPTAWSEIGFGGPAAPRGYVRLGFDQRDPWEAVEAESGREQETRRRNADVGRV